MPHLELSLLGPFQAILDGEPIAGFQSNKVRALLAYLAVEADRPHRREALAGLLWPGWPEPAARKNLRNALSNLRGVLGDRDAARPHLQVTRDTIQFSRGSDPSTGPGETAWLDVQAFQEALDASMAHCPQGTTPCDRCIERLERAAGLYGGDLLQGFSLPDSPEFEEWALLQREHLRRRMAEALGRLAEEQEGCGAYADAADTARRWTELAPWEERAHRALIRALALGGQRSAALAHYQAFCATLQEELGVAPEPETVGLVERVREGTLEQDAAAAPVRAEVVATMGRPSTRRGILGELESQTCLGRPLPASRRVPSNLPAQLIPLVGRAALLEQILARLHDPTCRLLTLVGPGGSGKTRLAIEAAGQLLAEGGSDAFPDGVCFVGLASLHAPDEMASTLAQALGLSPSGGSDPRAQLLDYLREKRLLLVLDNLEHLLEGVDLVVELLESAPRSGVLATSRARLDVPGEQLLPVPGMDVPPVPHPLGEGVGEEARYSAVQLFLQSAHRVRPDYQPGGEELAQVAEVCRLVGGMPLGILLAAAWMRILSPREIAAQLSGRLGVGLDPLATDWHGVPARQRSMRAVFDHSYQLLPEQQREVFQGLSVFRGGFTHAAAGEVFGATLRDLLALVDTSLLQRGSDGRYELHELLRQFGAGKLEEEPERAEGARDRHAAYYAAALERWAQAFQGPRQWAALTEFEGEIANVRAAWAWTVERGQVQWLDRALDAVHMFFTLQSRTGEAEAMCRLAAERLSPAAEASPAPPDLLRVLARLLAMRCIPLGNYRPAGRPLARELAQRSLALLERPELAGRDVRHERAFALMNWAIFGGLSGHTEWAQLFERAVALYQALGERWWTAYTLDRWGAMAMLYGELMEAKRLEQQSARLFRELGDLVGLTSALYWLTDISMHSGRFEEAERLARENLALRYQLAEDGRYGGHRALARSLLYLGRYAEALPFSEEGLALCAQMGKREVGMENAVGSIRAQVAQRRYEEARGRCQALLEESRRLGEPSYSSAALILLGWIDLAAVCYEEAWRRGQEAVALEGTEVERWMPEVRSAPLLGYAARGLGTPGGAQPFAVQALREAVDSNSVPALLEALPVVALALIDRGEAARGVETYALVMRYPYVANSRWFEDVTGRHIQAAAETLPPEVVAAAQERGRARELWATAEELLAELTGS